MSSAPACPAASASVSATSARCGTWGPRLPSPLHHPPPRTRLFRLCLSAMRGPGEQQQQRRKPGSRAPGLARRAPAAEWMGTARAALLRVPGAAARFGLDALAGSRRRCRRRYLPVCPRHHRLHHHHRHRHHHRTPSCAAALLLRRACPGGWIRSLAVLGARFPFYFLLILIFLRLLL